MKIQINSSAFAEAAVFAGKAISARPTNPVLSGLLIEASAGVLRLSGFDYEKSSRTTTAAEVLDAGHVLVPARMLTDILTKLPKNRDLEMVVDDGCATITAGKAKYTLAAMNVDEFPTMPELPAAAGSVDGALFAEAVAQVAGTASGDDILPILTAVQVIASGKQITLQATDRYRLAQRVIEWAPNDESIDQQWLVRGAALVDAGKLTTGELTVLAADQTIGFRSLNRATTTMIIDGDYPKIASLFPDTTPTSVTVNRELLAGVVDRISTVAERGTPIRLQVADGEIELDAGTGAAATGREFVDCDLDGEPITAAFNPYYLTHALKTIMSATVNLGFTTSARPVLVTPTDDTRHKHLLMPVRLPGMK